MSKYMMFILMFSLTFTAYATVSVGILPDGSMEVKAGFPYPGLTVSSVHPPSVKDPGGLVVTNVVMQGVRGAGYPGEPVLPVYPVVVLIPQDRDVVNVEVKTGQPVRIPLNHPVAPGQYQVPLSSVGPFPDIAPDAIVYSSASPYPDSCLDTINPQYCRGYELLAFNLRPVRYLPGEQTLLYYPELTAHILTRPSEGLPENVVRCRGLDADREWVRRKVLNPELVDTYHVDPVSDGTPLSGTRDEYRYVIVTDAAFQSAFQPLINHKMSHGLTGTIVTMDWVETNYTGVDRAEKLRNFVIDAYNNWNLEYLLLGGDDDRSDVGGESGDYIVPRRDFYSTTDYGETDENIPADMYYACLDGTFNNDGDGLWAEPNDGVGGGDIDWFGEVHVGRACVDSVAEVNAFVDFVITYENESPETPAMKRAYMLGELLWDDPTWGGDYKDEIKDGASTNGYTTVGFPDEWTVETLYDRDNGGNNSWGASDVFNIVNNENITVINHLGHSDVNYCMRLSNSDADTGFTNTLGFFGYSQGCYDGSFDNRSAPDWYGNVETYSYDCILEHFTTHASGPFAFIGNSRYGWGDNNTTNGSSQYYDRQFFDAVFGEEITELGAANQDSKEDNIGFLNYGANRWCAYELTLFGDPQTKLGGGISRVGTITLDRLRYASGVDMLIMVSDIDLDVNHSVPDTVQITVTSDTGDSETVTLTETDVASAIFQATIQVSDGSAVPGNGYLEGAHGTLFTATYIDADDGMGGYNIPRTATAEADFQPPTISSVTVTSITDTTAVVTFNTSESAKGTLFYGVGVPPNQAVPETTSGTTHILTATGLEECTFYYFYVAAIDDAGNTSEDDNNGSYYSFVSYECVEVLRENMDSDPGWTCQGSWEWGHPTGQNNDPYGEPDPTSGYTGDYVYGNNVEGDYNNNISGTEYLFTGAIDCSEGTGNMLSFWCWLGVEENTYDHASLDISNDGGASWINLWENPDSTLEGGSWEYWEFDISAVADGHDDVRIRWGLGPTDVGWRYCGWNIDDVKVSFLRVCDQVTPTPFPTNTPAPPTSTPTPHPTPPPPSPTPTHTSPPGAPTYTPQPTFTPVVSPTPTPDMPDELTMTFHLNKQMYSGGDRFLFTRTYANPYPAVALDEYIILDVYGNYYFWPSWTTDPTCRLTYLEGYTSGEEIILDFIWPDDVSESASGLYFWGAFLKPMTSVLMSNVERIEFGYH